MVIVCFNTNNFVFILRILVDKKIGVKHKTRLGATDNGP